VGTERSDFIFSQFLQLGFDVVTGSQVPFFFCTLPTSYFRLLLIPWKRTVKVSLVIVIDGHHAVEIVSERCSPPTMLVSSANCDYWTHSHARHYLFIMEVSSIFTFSH